ncbi:MAG TPA: MFS transporter [Nocardioides sp.]|nr:MFS transporter [Nocardioides sp.]
MSRLLEAVAPARLGRDFRWLLASSWASNLGDGIALAAGPLLVASQTQSPILVAMAALLQRLPWLLFGLYAGALADRLDRRVVVIVSDLLRAVVLLVLTAAIVTDQVSIAWVLVAMFLLGVAEVFADTTSNTLLPMLVEKRDLGVANSRLMAGFITVNQMAGPPLGAILFAVGLAVPFMTQAVVVLLGALLVARIATPKGAVRDASGSRVSRDIVEGVRWVWHHHAVRTLALVMITFNVTWGAAWSVLVLYATQRLGMGEIGFGLLTTAAAVGGLISTSWYRWLEERVPLAALMRACLTLEVLMHLALAVNTVAWVAIAIMVVFGAYAFVWGTLSTAVRQRAVPTELQGRVGSVYLVGVFGGIVLGQALGGVIADIWGLAAPFWFAFVGSGITLLLIWRQLGHIAYADEQAQATA